MIEQMSLRAWSGASRTPDGPVRVPETGVATGGHARVRPDQPAPGRLPPAEIHGGPALAPSFRDPVRLGAKHAALQPGRPLPTSEVAGPEAGCPAGRGKRCPTNPENCSQAVLSRATVGSTACAIGRSWRSTPPPATASMASSSTERPLVMVASSMTSGGETRTARLPQPSTSRPRVNASHCSASARAGVGSSTASIRPMPRTASTVSGCRSRICPSASSPCLPREAALSMSSSSSSSRVARAAAQATGLPP